METSRVYDDKDVYVVLPYLTTSNRCLVRGVEFRANTDLSDFPEDVQRHFDTISKMFFLQDGLRIDEMTCAFVRMTGSGAECERHKQNILDAHLLIAFLYSQTQSDGGIFMPFEFSSVFEFQQGSTRGPSADVPTSLVWSDGGYGNRVKRVDDRKVPETDCVPGFQCWRNFTSMFWTAEGSRIFPEIPHISLNHWQDLFQNLGELVFNQARWPWARFYLGQRGDLAHVESRVFLALQWYLRSCRAGIHPEEAIVHLGIALETLLGVGPGESKTDRLKVAITAMLGHVHRLDSWFDQFYGARSGAVHEGVPGTLNFYAKGPPKRRKRESIERHNEKEEDDVPVRPLIEYGRRVFRHCFEGMLFSAYAVKSDNLGELFVHNLERLEKICRLLKDTASSERVTEEASSAVAHLRDCASRNCLDQGVPPKLVLSVAAKLIERSLQSKPPLSEAAVRLMEQFVAGGSGDESAQFDTLSDIDAAICSPTDRGRWNQWVGVLSVFLQYALSGGFQLQCRIRKPQKKGKK